MRLHSAGSFMVEQQQTLLLSDGLQMLAQMTIKAQLHAPFFSFSILLQQQPMKLRQRTG